jgi:prepilin-type N-terminal cleavage/methylation domain-containing protein
MCNREESNTVKYGMDKIRRDSGFSLVEIMVSVAIIAVLASIAFPTYRVFSKKARASEAASGLRAIRIHQLSYRMENDAYLDLDPNPPGDVPADYQSWGDPGGNWDLLGFAMDDRVRYQYKAEAGDTGNIVSSFKITAQTDFDGEGEPYDTWTIDNRSVLTHTDHYK